MRRTGSKLMTVVALAASIALAQRARGDDASSKGSVDVTPEASIAALIRQFQQSADEFTAQRRLVVRERQTILDETEEDTAQAKIRLDELTTIWRLTGGGGKVALVEGILAASRSSAAALGDLDALVEGHRADRAKLDSSASFRQDKLSAAAKALTTLGSDESLAEVARFYAGYLRETKAALDALQKDAAKPAAASTPSAPPSTGAPAPGAPTSTPH